MYAASAAKYVGVPSDRTSTRSLSSPCALVRAHTAASFSYVSRRAIASGMSASTSLSRAQRVEVDAEPLERLLDALEHHRHRVAGERGQLGHVRARVPVLGRLLAAPERFDGVAEAVHLRAGVVVVVLALDVVTGEGQQPRHRVAVRAVPRVRDRDRPGRVRRDHLDLDPLRRRRRPRAERVPGREDLAERLREPCVRDVEVDEAGRRRLRPLDEATLQRRDDDLAGDVERRLPARAARRSATFVA